MKIKNVLLVIAVLGFSLAKAQTAEEIIDEIRNSRVSTREIESLICS